MPPFLREVAVYAFKAFQIRIYGVQVPIKGKGTFVGMEMVTDKKRKKADRALLARVAQKSRSFWE